MNRIPALGIAVPAADAAALEAKLGEFKVLLDRLPKDLKSKPALLELAPDVEVFYKAVHDALAYQEFYSQREIATAQTLLDEGRRRAEALLQGSPFWTKATGLVVRGYRSKIDGSVQPYGLVVPASFQPGSPFKHRLDLWFHGRGEKLTELSFINGRMRQIGDFAPPDTFVLHPYGRFCCANRFAGEVDTFEALAHARKSYPIDENRLSVRGFSMGGAACWQFAVHSAGMWAAAAPGAGFSETADFLKVFQRERVQPASWEQKLWHLYDSVDYAINLYQCPTVAYSGEIDPQKQAADMMAKALAKEGIQMVHVIGPKTKHTYEPKAKEEVSRRIDAIMARGRDPLPSKIHFTTWTLRYNEMLWVTVDALGQHWERARVDAEIVGSNAVKLKTENVKALTLSMAPGLCPLEMTQKPKVIIDGQTIEAPAIGSDRSWTAHFRKEAASWHAVPTSGSNQLAKRHGLQGPIDDAFMDSFVMVRPSGKAMNPAVDAWVQKEMAHAIEHWRRQFRGNARVLSDDQID
ncbi:MAG TPA: prolyl oligopeptidase family serine peptidase, partial [Gemmataceae bacterium]|nr:prolyl oligopeptidase family serine peptidase [Gemmataceae bacterium]